jgi:hypothetical protein
MPLDPKVKRIEHEGIEEARGFSRGDKSEAAATSKLHPKMTLMHP